MLEDREMRLEDLRLEELRLLVACAVLGDAELEALVEYGRPSGLQVSAPETLAGMQVNVAGNERTFLEDLVKIANRKREAAQDAQAS